MINFFRKLFNHDKIDKLNADLDACLEGIKRHEAEVREYKGYKLKYQVAMLQNDEAEFLELLEMAEEVEKHKARDRAIGPFGSQSQLLQSGLASSGLASSAFASATQQQAAARSSLIGSNTTGSFGGALGGIF
jgi:hypothetical protein